MGTLKGGCLAAQPNRLISRSPQTAGLLAGSGRDSLVRSGTAGCDGRLRVVAAGSGHQCRRNVDGRVPEGVRDSVVRGRHCRRLEAGWSSLILLAPGKLVGALAVGDHMSPRRSRVFSHLFRGSYAMVSSATQCGVMTGVGSEHHS